MAGYFLDSSAIVKRYIQEPGTAWVRSLYIPRAGHVLYIARIAGAEVISAIARRTRGGDLSPSASRSAIEGFRRDFAEVYRISEITLALVERAMDLAQTRALRGYDAVQLATVLTMNAQRLQRGMSLLTLVSADGELNAAAQVEGILVENPTAYA